MLIIPNTMRGRRRRAVNPAPAGPVLLTAVYESQTLVTLTFDRPVTVTADALTAVTVVDGTQGEAYHGEDFDVLSPTRVRVNLYFTEPFAGEGITMTAIPPTGIVATDDGAAWAGVIDWNLQA